MKFSRFLSQAVAVSVLAVAAIAAHGETYYFSLSGTDGFTATWTLDSSPHPDLVIENEQFGLYGVTGDFPASVGATAELYFYNNPNDIGGMAINAPGEAESAMSGIGPGLYTGSESAPTFLLGTYSLEGYQTTYTLTISDMAPVPEPATVPLLLGGLACVGLVARRRR